MFRGHGRARRRVYRQPNSRLSVACVAAPSKNPEPRAAGVLGDALRGGDGVCQFLRYVYRESRVLR